MIETIRSGHHGVSLSGSDFERLATWVDLNAPYYGRYTSNFPGNESGRSPLTDGELNTLISLTGVNVKNIKGLGEQVSFDRPASSPCLSGVTGDAYDQALALIQAGKSRLESVTRSDMAEYVMSAGIDLWREEKYQHRRQRETMNRAAMAGDGLVYDYQGLLAIAQYAPEGVDGISSRIQGSVLYSGNDEEVDIILVWGSQDMGDDLNAWENNTAIGSQPVGDFDYLLGGLTPGQPLYYRIFASNSDGNTNTHTSGSFETRSLIDLDADGMSDSWERSFFGGLDICHANSDWDGDGQSDAQEYHSGTDPSDPNSSMRVIAFQSIASDQHRLSWKSEEKVSYEIWGSQDMKHWVQLTSGLQATPPVNTEDLDLADDASYFFRVHAQHAER
ncbi:hypothetical protein HW115_03820 [Verrucomicrobiaceae bacterium N1E253]|uniref:Fibronectin type-III domain-containing protein n=1 Tax=Oceaniferula marina TaxID=2748318 RepID=A0A851GAT1_9BACT|nr:hypothetical protein [Oceaniferula marina]NWK54723.1 hypothetical protein [Oceaniferula marina]